MRESVRTNGEIYKMVYRFVSFEVHEGIYIHVNRPCFFDKNVLKIDFRGPIYFFPYLYIICTEGLSRLIKQNIHNRNIHGFKASRSGPAISHFLFADDSLVFCKATEEESRNLSNILATYQKASGHEVNYAKSAIVFSKGTSSLLQSSISRLSLPEHIGKKIEKRHSNS